MRRSHKTLNQWSTFEVQYSREKEWILFLKASIERGNSSQNPGTLMAIKQINKTALLFSEFLSM